MNDEDESALCLSLLTYTAVGAPLLTLTHNMIPYYCPQEKIPGSRFCLQCGEKLNLPFSKGIYPGLLLGDRYRVVSQLGRVALDTYLAEDTNRFSELCV